MRCSCSKANTMPRFEQPGNREGNAKSIAQIGPLVKGLTGAQPPECTWQSPTRVHAEMCENCDSASLRRLFAFSRADERKDGATAQLFLLHPVELPLFF